MPRAALVRDAWCPSQCPIGDGAMRRHFAEHHFTYRPGLHGRSRCDLCAGRWLFVVSAGGRTGSTTLLNMLNLHPAFSLAGENNKQLDDAFELWMKAAYQRWRSAPWQRDAPNPASLLCLLQQWFVEISNSPTKHAGGVTSQASAPGASSFIHGFKEIRWQATAQRLRSSAAFGPNVDLPPLPPANVSMLHFTSLLFPCSRFIFNTRESPSSLRRKVGRKRFAASHIAALADLHRSWGAQSRSFWLPLENFTVGGFNELLSWLGEDGCRFGALLHNNGGGSMNAQTPTAKQRRGILPESEAARCTLAGSVHPRGDDGEVAHASSAHHQHRSGKTHSKSKSGKTKERTKSKTKKTRSSHKKRARGDLPTSSDAGNAVSEGQNAALSE